MELEVRMPRINPSKTNVGKKEPRRKRNRNVNRTETRVFQWPAEIGLSLFASFFRESSGPLLFVLRGRFFRRRLLLFPRLLLTDLFELLFGAFRVGDLLGLR